ncbi:MAG: tRNA (adenosine(37)-N6)-dimethylallyltransferase MiaA [Prevotella sp.]|uniref:tRNA (adenosine(37)-N6)-dimethylallyltransferase MiaA n=1 Tax=Prevotella sp. TaxID=59823 RepID=UPI002A2D1721|nr:tRNA (adenosine(37)-N6)-dimethylallyltransferase MiaA [Prevotella sp.]MDD7318087.1 tRNA (adenosine(37)-N6)-dimethylallyltransferase MiaA [Prevotellaceae bacterium]MDY4021024.1 tRNA (adenosine(37)-N6)-dimethylallyltransferase MiaA [Prevotella sp.]
MITILGPTASGKTALSAHLAARIGGEIISADSRQVYRRMDIGTGKDLGDYVVAGKQIPYHLIDIAEPGTKYNLFRYQQDFHNAYNDILGRGVEPILCGGTGLYIEAALKGYALSPVPQNAGLRDSLAGKSLDELTGILRELKARNHSVMHNKTDVDTVQRAIRAIEIETYNAENHTEERAMPKIKSLVIGVNIDRDARRKKITERLRQRLEEGMVEEIRGLIESGVAPCDLIYYGLEYKFVTEYVTGKTTREEMFLALETAIHQFAKRQMTWFRGMERRGTEIKWVDAGLTMEEKIERILNFRKEITGNFQQME